MQRLEPQLALCKLWNCLSHQAGGETQVFHLDTLAVPAVPYCS